MKKWKIIYWSNLYKTESIVKANNREEAKKKFKILKGEQDIIQIYEI